MLWGLRGRRVGVAAPRGLLEGGAQGDAAAAIRVRRGALLGHVEPRPRSHRPAVPPERLVGESLHLGWPLCRVTIVAHNLPASVHHLWGGGRGRGQSVQGGHAGVGVLLHPRGSPFLRDGEHRRLALLGGVLVGWGLEEGGVRVVTGERVVL